MTFAVGVYRSDPLSSSDTADGQQADDTSNVSDESVYESTLELM